MNDIMLLNKSDRYTQRNNAYRPFEACMPTTYVMWCIAEKIEILSKIPAGQVADNYLMELLNTNDAILFAKKKYPDLIKAGYTPNQIHGMYHSYLEPLIFGEILSDFIYAGNNDGQGLNFDEFKTKIGNNHALWTSGAYQGVRGPIEGHANLFCGVYGEDLRNVDPYGNPLTKYIDDSGFDIRYSRQFFIDHVKPVGSLKKNCHIKRGIS